MLSNKNVSVKDNSVGRILVRLVQKAIYFEINVCMAITSDTEERYHGKFFNTSLEDTDFGELLYERDGAICHATGKTITLLAEKLPKRLISRW